LKFCNKTLNKHKQSEVINL